MSRALFIALQGPWSGCWIRVTCCATRLVLEEECTKGTTRKEKEIRDSWIKQLYLSLLILCQLRPRVIQESTFGVSSTVQCIKPPAEMLTSYTDGPWSPGCSTSDLAPCQCAWKSSGEWHKCLAPCHLQDHFGSMYTKTGMMQRRFAWILHKDGTQIHEELQDSGFNLAQPGICGNEPINEQSLCLCSC